MKKIILIIFFVASKLFLFGQVKVERLHTAWPSNWKIAAISNDSIHFKVFTQVVPYDESIAKWSILGHMGVQRNIIAPNLDKIIRVFSNAATQNSPKSKFTVLEKNDTTKNFWVLYKVETSDFPNDPVPESQLNYVIQGETSLFITFVAIKEKNLSNEFINRWSKILKESYLTYN